MLTKILLDRDIAPSKKFDWNNYEESKVDDFEESADDKIDYSDTDIDEYKYTLTKVNNSGQRNKLSTF